MSNPDVLSNFALEKGATQSVSVTQKPKSIFYISLNQQASSNFGESVIMDVESNTGYFVAEYSGGYQNAVVHIGDNSCSILSVSDSAVVIKNVSTAVSRHYNIAIYY